MATDKECVTGLDRLMTDIRVKVPGATDDQIKLNLYNAMDQHLRKTNAWRYTTEVPLIRGQVEYPIFPPGDSTMVRVIEATHAGHPVTPDLGGLTSSGQRRTPDRRRVPLPRGRPRLLRGSRSQ